MLQGGFRSSLFGQVNNPRVGVGKPRGNNFSNSVAEIKFKLSVSVVYFDQGTGASLFQHFTYYPVTNGKTRNIPKNKEKIHKKSSTSKDYKVIETLPRA